MLKYGSEGWTIYKCVEHHIVNEIKFLEGIEGYNKLDKLKKSILEEFQTDFNCSKYS